MSTLGIYQIGDLRISKITEQVFSALSVGQLYPEFASQGATAEHIKHDEPVEMSVHSWLVETPQRKLLIDTASGNFKDRPFSRLFHQLNSPWLLNLKQAGVRPEDIDFVLHTHLHVDHIGWNTVWDGKQWLPTFDHAVHVCSQAELDFYETPEAASRMVVYKDSIKPVLDAGRLETIDNDGREYFSGITFHPTPGHSPGHMSISIQAGDEYVLFCGDVMHSPLQVAQPNLSSVFCAQHFAAQRSRKWLLAHAADTCATVFTSHFAESSVGRIKKSNNGQYSWNFI